MKKVQVLLSSYNGQKYIREQLDSILNQEDVDVHCLVRDDGSTDETNDILREYQTKHKNIEVLCEKNIGYKASFMKLVRVSGEYDYYSFADQDDVWKPDKIIQAIYHIEENEYTSPAMYCSNCTVVDENLRYIRELHSNDTIVPNKEKALVEGFAHGCTMVFNKKTRDLILKYDLKKEYPHDFWIPLIMVYLGKVIYDKNSYILYRQHSDNVFGSQSELKRIIKKGINKIKNKNSTSDMINEILAGYGDYLLSKDYCMLNEIAEYDKSISKKIRLLFNKNIRKSTIRGTIFLKVLILFSRF